MAWSMASRRTTSCPKSWPSKVLLGSCGSMYFRTYKSRALVSVESTPNVRRPARSVRMKRSSRWRGTCSIKPSALTPRFGYRVAGLHQVWNSWRVMLLLAAKAPRAPAASSGQLQPMRHLGLHMIGQGFESVWASSVFCTRSRS